MDSGGLAGDAIPVTSYKPARESHDATTTRVIRGGTAVVPARDHYRVAWRAWPPIPVSGRYPCADPAGAAHVTACFRLVPGSALENSRWQRACLSSLLVLTSRPVAPKSEHPSGIYRPATVCDRRIVAEPILSCALFASTASRMPTPISGSECFDRAIAPDAWTGGFDHAGRPRWATSSRIWTPDTPLRIARRPPPGTGGDRRAGRADARLDRRRVVHGLSHPVPGALRLRPQRLLSTTPTAAWCRTRCSPCGGRKATIDRRGADRHQPGWQHLHLRAAVRVARPRGRHAQATPNSRRLAERTG